MNIAGGSFEIKLLLFAQFREVIGQKELLYKVTIGSTPASVLRSLIEEYPDLARLESVTKFIVNEEFVPGDYKLSPGDTLALIPPVAGGRDDSSDSRSHIH